MRALGHCHERELLSRGDLNPLHWALSLVNFSGPGLCNGVLRRCHRTRGRAASIQELLAVHDPDLVGALEQATAKAAGQPAGEDEGYGFSLRRK